MVVPLSESVMTLRRFPQSHINVARVGIAKINLLRPHPTICRSNIANCESTGTVAGLSNRAVTFGCCRNADITFDAHFHFSKEEQHSGSQRVDALYAVHLNKAIA